MMAMWLPSFIASSRSWLTKMMVFFSARCSSSSSSCRRLRISGSSAEKGSSIRRMSASVANARASPTRCCMPPESSWANLSPPLLETTIVELLRDHLVALGLRHAAQFEAEADVLGDRAPGQQRELLEHHGDALGAQVAQRRRIAAGDVDRSARVVDQHLAAGHLVEAVDGSAAASTCRSPTGPSARRSRPSRSSSVASATPSTWPVCLEDLVARPARVEQRQRLLGLRAEDDVDLAEVDLGGAVSAVSRRSFACVSSPRAACTTGRAGSRRARWRARPRSLARC